MEQTNNAPSYRKEQLQSFAGQNSPFGIPSGNIKAQVPEQSGPLVQKKRSSLIPKINLGGIFSLGPKSTKPNSAANVGNNSGNPSLTPPNNSNGDQDEVAMFFNFLAGITELPVCREYDAEMDLPVEQRDHFKFNPEDSETAKKMFKGVLALFFQTYFHQLDPTKVDSLEKLLNFEKNDLPRSVSVKRGLKVDYIFPEDMKRVYEMVHTSFKNITTAEEAEKLVEEINKKNKPFLEKVGEDECRMNFPTPWINIAGEYLAALANKDILPCLEKATVKTPPKDFMKYFNLLIAGRDIVKRKWLAVDVRLDLLEKMKPVIEGFIDYSLAIPSSRTREVNQLRGTALDIQSEFNEPLDMFIPLKPKAETLPGDTSKPTDAPENGGKPGANAEQTNNEGKDGAGTETTPTSTNEKALDSEATSENDANSAAEPGSKEPTADHHAARRP